MSSQTSGSCTRSRDRRPCAHAVVFIEPSSHIEIIVNMEHIGTLPNENEVLLPAIISLFGILCQSSASKDEKFHFSKEKITKRQFLVMKSPCCRHLVHAECFKTCSSAFHIGSNVHCAYCRKPYTRMKKHALCVCTKNNSDENLTSTNCCHTLMNSQCAVSFSFCSQL